MGRALGEESLRDERPDVLRDVLLRDPDGVREAGLGDVGRDAVLPVLRPVLREVDEDPLSDGQPHGQIPHATKEWTSWVQMNFVGFLRSSCDRFLTLPPPALSHARRTEHERDPGDSSSGYR